MNRFRAIILRANAIIRVWGNAITLRANAIRPNFWVFVGAVLMVFLLQNCSATNDIAVEDRATNLMVKNIIAIDISENLTPLATQNDEVFFMINAVKKSGDNYSIVQEHLFPELLFDSLNISHDYWGINFPLQETDYVLFSLVELDDYDSHQKVEKLLKGIITRGDFLQKLDKIEMDSIFSNDDFLGIRYLKSDRISKGSEKALRISGSHLFDKYEYRINVVGI